MEHYQTTIKHCQVETRRMTLRIYYMRDYIYGYYSSCLSGIKLSCLINRFHLFSQQWLNRPVSQMRVLLVVCRELVADYNTLPDLLHVFEHKM